MKIWTADLSYNIPATRNAALFPAPQQEARQVIDILRVCWNRKTSGEDFMREFPTDSNGAISMTAQARAWRYEMDVDGRRVIVRQERDTNQPTVTVNETPVTLPDLTGITVRQRAGQLADLIHAALG
ncbi:hypothetical protein [Streptomyces sp. NBC_00134]|uniref:hypothetical protein n=1 Tax=Streptomyces sp. NBC_00134 TaxID=2975663 RepID=UPI002F90D4EB